MLLLGGSLLLLCLVLIRHFKHCHFPDLDGLWAPGGPTPHGPDCLTDNLTKFSFFLSASPAGAVWLMLNSPGVRSLGFLLDLPPLFPTMEIGLFPRSRKCFSMPINPAYKLMWTAWEAQGFLWCISVRERDSLSPTSP